MPITRYIFETATIGVTDGAVSVDDIVETANHFCCIDFHVRFKRIPSSRTATAAWGG